MKTLVLILAALILLLVVAVFAVPPAADLAGTWKGTTVVPSGETDEVTLTLEKREDGWQGRITDTLGMVTDAAISNFAYVDGRVTFDFSLDDGSGISIELTYSEGKLEGFWSGDGGESGRLEFTRVEK